MCLPNLNLTYLSDTDWQGICPLVMEVNENVSKMYVVTWLDLCFAKMAPSFSINKIVKLTIENQTLFQ